MAQISDLKTKAEKYLKAEKFEKAIEVYHELVDKDAKNPRWSKKLGEMYERIEQNAQAVDAFSSALKLYLDQGFDLKAVAMCRVILGIDSTHKLAKERLVELYSSRFKSTKKKKEESEITIDIEVELDDIGEEHIVLSEEPMLILGNSMETIELSKVANTSAFAEHGIEINLEEIDAAFDAIDSEEEHLADYAAAIRPTPLLSSLDEASFWLFIKRVKVKNYQDGQTIIAQNTYGDTLYILVDGDVDIYREAKERVHVSSLSEGAFFGEIALVTNRARTATVEAKGECTVLEITRDAISEILDKNEKMLFVMLRFLRERLIDTLVDTHKLFTAFAEVDRHQLADRFSFLEINPNKTLIKKGEESGGLYILLAGEAEEKSGPRSLELKVGDIFGEKSLISSELSDRDVVTKTKCWMLYLEEGVFREIMMTHPHVLAVLSEGVDDKNTSQPVLI